MSGENRTPGDHQLSSIQIPDELKEHYKVLSGVGETEDRVLNLKGLSRVNLFVGPNNSGKSRFLRGVAAAKELRFHPKLADQKLHEISSTLMRAHKELERQLNGEVVQPAAPSIALLISNKCVEGLDIFVDFRNVLQSWSNLGPRDVSARRGTQVLHLDEHTRQKLLQAGHLALDAWDEFIKSSSPKLVFQRMYVSTLRGLRPLPNPDVDVYTDRVRKDYFTESTKVEVFTGLKLYDELSSLLLGDRKQRQLVREYEDFLSTHLFGNRVSLIPRKGKDVVYVKIGNEEERAIYELGDGVQHVIILTFPLFSHQDKPTLVFIEEPELFLHPGMQRTLLKAMMLFPDHQYFVSTHSNHLLDLAMEPEFEDVSIFKLRKETGAEEGVEDVKANFTVELAVAHDHQMLEMLGVRVSSVFLTNCTIWVEGITDRLYFAKFLKLYCEHLEREAGAEEKGGARPFRPRQDYHFSFVEYSGGNITHWSFLDDHEQAMQADRLCAHMMLIADRDDGKDARHEKLEKKLGDRFYRLSCQEVENLLTPEVINAVVRSYEGDACHDVEFTQSAYKLKGLGTFIEETWPDLKRRGGYAEKATSKSARARKYKTIKDKPAFCERALKAMTDYCALSDEAKELAMKMYQFILANNKEGKRA